MGRERGILVGVAALAFVLGGLGGISRIGLLPADALASPAQRHGLLIVTALALLVSIVRATLSLKRWTWLAPALFAASALSAVAGMPDAITALIAIVAGGALIVVAAVGAVASPPLARGALTLSAVAWTIAAALGLASTLAQQVPWWIAFLVLAIAGERIDLGRARRARPDVTVAASAVLLFGGAILSLGDDTAFGLRVEGAGAVVLAAWMFWHDRPAPDARRFAQYMAAGTTLGYAWLVAGGLLAFAYDGVAAGWIYDALLHAFFAGFAMTMVFCHVPMLLPAAMHLSFAYTEALYAALAMLSGSVITRIAGDALGSATLQAAGAVGIGIAFVTEALLVAVRTRARRSGT